eukprot:1070025-Amphidinium_carterae.1
MGDCFVCQQHSNKRARHHQKIMRLQNRPRQFCANGPLAKGPFYESPRNFSGQKKTCQHHSVRCVKTML